MDVIELTNEKFQMSFVKGFGLGGCFVIIVYLIWRAWSNRDK